MAHKPYHDNDMKRFYAETAAHTIASKQEFREREEKLLDCWNNYPEMFGERISWIFNGSYGYAAMVKAIEIAEMKGRSNKAAMLSQLAALVEWFLPQAHVLKTWHKLTQEQQERLTAIVEAELKYFHDNREQFEVIS